MHQQSSPNLQIACLCICVLCISKTCNTLVQLLYYTEIVYTEVKVGKRMQDHIIVAVFPSQRGLLKALDHLLEEAVIDVRKAAVVIKSKTGEIMVLDDDLSSEDGGLLGSIFGAAIASIGLGLIGLWTIPGVNPLLVLLSAFLLGAFPGGLVGQFVSRTVRFSFERPYIDKIADKLQHGTSALMLRVEDASTLLPRLQVELQPYQAVIVDHLQGITPR